MCGETKYDIFGSAASILTLYFIWCDLVMELLHPLACNSLQLWKSVPKKTMKQITSSVGTTSRPCHVSVWPVCLMALNLPLNLKSLKFCFGNIGFIGSVTLEEKE